MEKRVCMGSSHLERNTHFQLFFSCTDCIPIFHYECFSKVINYQKSSFMNLTIIHSKAKEMQNDFLKHSFTSGSSSWPWSDQMCPQIFYTDCKKSCPKISQCSLAILKSLYVCHKAKFAKQLKSHCNKCKFGIFHIKVSNNLKMLTTFQRPCKGKIAEKKIVFCGFLGVICTQTF